MEVRIDIVALRRKLFNILCYWVGSSHSISRSLLASLLACSIGNRCTFKDSSQRSPYSLTVTTDVRTREHGLPEVSTRK